MRTPRPADRLLPVRLLIALLLALAAGAPAAASGERRDARDAFGPFLDEGSGPRPHSGHRSRHGDRAASWLRHWNAIAIDASGLDHTPVAPGEDRAFGEQLGPGRASRAMAIVHVAMFEAAIAIEGRYRSYAGLPRVRHAASVKAAIAQAAHDTLAAMYPSQAAAFDAALADDLARVQRGSEKWNGIALGRRAAAAILALRADDGSQHAEPRVGIEWSTSDLPGRWRQDPVSLIPLALGAHWGEVAPFVLDSADQFRAPPPPPLASPGYAAAFDEVKRLGGDGVVTPTERSDEQTFVGIYWAYDGTPSLCAPPRLYNQIALAIAGQAGTDGVLELGRLLALVNVAMADAGIAAWDSKYFHDVWRPVTGVREADPGTGPTGLGDGNDATPGDPAFTPLGAPASNLAGAPDFTPPFPAYPSGHATFGGALFQTLRNFYGTDDIPFTFVSDEWNGETLGSDGAVRPRVPRHFASLSEAEEENGQSRIYLGIHWSFDKTEGIAQGRRVADHVFDHAFQPVRGRRDPR
jgi:hypothetical protein